MWASGREVHEAVRAALTREDPALWVQRVYDLLLVDRSWQAAGGAAWEAVAVTVGALQPLFFDASCQATMLSMWCVVLSVPNVDPRALRAVVYTVLYKSLRYTLPSMPPPIMFDATPRPVVFHTPSATPSPGQLAGVGAVAANGGVEVIPQTLSDSVRDDIIDDGPDEDLIDDLTEDVAAVPSPKRVPTLALPADANGTTGDPQGGASPEPNGVGVHEVLAVNGGHVGAPYAIGRGGTVRIVGREGGSRNICPVLAAVAKSSTTRARVDEAFIVMKIIAENGGATGLLGECEEVLIAHASAPLKPVAVDVDATAAATSGSVLLQHVTDEWTPEAVERAVGAVYAVVTAAPAQVGGADGGEQPHEQQDASAAVGAPPGLLTWSDGKVSSLEYTYTCWRRLAVETCVVLLANLPVDDAADLAAAWGGQLAVDSTSTHSLAILELVAPLTYAYQLLTAIVAPIVTTSRRGIHRARVIDYIVAEHPQYVTRRRFLEAIYAADTTTQRHFLASLYTNIVTAPDPCVRREVQKALAVVVGDTAPSRGHDSEAPSEELVARLVAKIRTVERQMPVKDLRGLTPSPEVLSFVVAERCLTHVRNKFSVAQRYTNVLVELLQNPHLFPHFVNERNAAATALPPNTPLPPGVGPVCVGDVPSPSAPPDATLPTHDEEAELLANGLLRLLAMTPAPRHPDLLRIWKRAFPAAPDAGWEALNAGVRLTQVSTYTRLCFSMGWLCRQYRGDSTNLKDVCGTSTFLRHLFFVHHDVATHGHAFLVGPSAHKSALCDSYVQLANKTKVEVHPGDSLEELAMWLQSPEWPPEQPRFMVVNLSQRGQALARCTKQNTVLVFEDGVLPTPGLLEHAAAAGVIVLGVVSVKHYRTADAPPEPMVWVSPLPTDEVHQVVLWGLREWDVDQTLTPGVAQCVAAFHEASQTTKKPLALKATTGIVRDVARAVDGAEGVGVVMFEIAAWVGAACEADVVAMRAELQARVKDPSLAARVQEAVKHDDEAEEERLRQLVLQRTPPTKSLLGSAYRTFATFFNKKNG